MFMRTMFERIYSDYLMPSRLSSLEGIYQTALHHGYQMHSVESFWELIKNDAVDESTKYFINRHDIDTGIKTAQKIFEIEERLGIKSSYYFRLSTVDLPLMKRIFRSGSEVSYHFEEIATLAKKHRWREVSAINPSLVEIEFTKNVNNFRDLTGASLKTVCSHGDFVNRYLDVPNHSLLTSLLRDKLNIELETYDAKFMRYVTARYSDAMYPRLYNGEGTPLEAINNNEHVIYLLTHPRHWNSEFLVNTHDNICRMWQGFFYGLGER